jgi:N-acetyl-anhydromuramyl-L-alanine amidase AmpD
MNPQGAKRPRAAWFLTALCLGVLVVLNSSATTVAPVRQWDLIVIHHSATRTGDAEIFDAAHRSRGMVNGLAYHFVIDNGTEDMPDGHIEVGSRWVNQLQGGHCRQSYINERAIGICLVGNFSKGQPTPKQLASLALLIHGLQEQFKIPDDHILGHGDVVGEYSECPGKDFPWDDLKKLLLKKTP